MAYTFISHGNWHLEIASDDRQHYRFRIIKDELGRSALVCEKHWQDNRPVDPPEPFLKDAARFASACAKDFGLM